MIERIDLLGSRVESLMREANSQKDDISGVKDDVNVLKTRISLLESQVSVLESQIDLFISSDSENNMVKENRQKIREIERGLAKNQKIIEENGERINFLQSFMKLNENVDEDDSDSDSDSDSEEVDTSRNIDIVIDIKSPQKDDAKQSILNLLLVLHYSLIVFVLYLALIHNA